VYAAALQTVQLIKVNTTNFELSSVITLQAGWSLRVDEHGNMIVNTGSSLMIGSTNPLIDGVASPGSDTQYVSGATHVHPYPQHIQSNATTGLLQVLGPGAGTTRVMTTPNADFTVARTNGANTFNATQTISNGSLALSSTTDVTAEVATTGNSNAATIACSTGDGTTSGRYAYCYMISLETAPQRWDFGMRGTKSFVIRNQTLTRNDLTVNETSGTVSAAAFQGAYNSSDGTAGKTVVVSIGANTLTFKNGILTANT
jgi:hypothetical protein